MPVDVTINDLPENTIPPSTAFVEIDRNAGGGVRVSEKVSLQNLGAGSGGSYTDEQAQDAVGSILSAEFTYSDPTPSIAINAIAQSKITNLVSDLALKASLASPALTGTPTAPTAAPGTNTTQLATAAFVQSAIAGISPGGSDNQVQYKSGSAFAGTNQFTVGATTPAIGDNSGNELLKFTKVADAVNELTISNAATGASPKIEATGNDINIGVDITAKGTGSINLSADAVSISKYLSIRNNENVWFGMGTPGNTFIIFGQAGGIFTGNYWRQQILYGVGLGFGHDGNGSTVGLWSPAAGLLEVSDGVGSGSYHRDLKLRNLYLTGGVIPATNAQTGISYTLTSSDNGKILTFSNTLAITVTVPAGLGAGFNCVIIQKGAGQITFSPSTTTINNRQSHTKSAGQHAVVSLIADVANNFYLGGDTAA